MAWQGLTAAFLMQVCITICSYLHPQHSSVFALHFHQTYISYRPYCSISVDVLAPFLWFWSTGWMILHLPSPRTSFDQAVRLVDATASGLFHTSHYFLVQIFPLRSASSRTNALWTASIVGCSYDQQPRINALFTFSPIWNFPPYRRLIFICTEYYPDT